MKKSNVAYNPESKSEPKTTPKAEPKNERVQESWAGGTYRQNLNGGYDCQIYVAGKQWRRRVRRQSQAKEWLEQMAEGKTALTSAETHEAQQAFMLVRKFGNGKTLLECLRCGLDSDTLKAITFSKAIEQYLRTISGRLSKYTTDNYRWHLGRLMSFIGGDTSLVELTDEKLKEYTDSLEYSPQTHNHFLRAFKAFWHWTAKQRYTTKNPARFLGYVETNTPERKFLSIEQTKRLLLGTATLYPDLVPYVVLGLFAGTRPTETMRLRAKNIMMNTGYIKIDDNTSKTSTGRMIEMSANLKEWLSLYPVTDKVVHLAESPIKKRLRIVNKKYGVGLSPDVLRHSYATYSVAESENPAKTAMMMGNSEQICKLHYRGLVTKPEGIKYFELTPYTMITDIVESDLPPEKPKRKKKPTGMDEADMREVFDGFLKLEAEKSAENQQSKSNNPKAKTKNLNPS